MFISIYYWPCASGAHLLCTGVWGAHENVLGNVCAAIQTKQKKLILLKLQACDTVTSTKAAKISVTLPNFHCLGGKVTVQYLSLVPIHVTLFGV